MRREKDDRDWEVNCVIDSNMNVQMNWLIYKSYDSYLKHKQSNKL